MESIKAGLKNQPQLIHRTPSTEKKVNFTTGVYRPQPVFWRGSTKSAGASGRYDDSQLVSQMWGDRNRSMTNESEGEAADTEEVMTDRDASLTRQLGSPSSVSGVPHAKKELPPQQQMPPQHMRPPPSPGRPQAEGMGGVILRKGKRRKKKEPKDQPLDIKDPDPVDFNKYGMTAQLWMEQVDKKTVEKSRTMYMAVLPEDQKIPEELMKNIPDQPSGHEDDGEVFMPAQWVIARGRSIRRKKRRLESKLDSMSEGATTSGGESDWEAGSRLSSPGRQMLLFFKVGGNWQDLAWILFDGVQSDADTLRMIKDIQLKHKGKLTEQVQDMMHRWWQKKGSAATIEQLQKALELVNMVYIQEIYYNDPVHGRSSVAQYTDTEEENLDISGISDHDPEVRRLNEEYNMRSLNASFDVSKAPNRELNTEQLIQKLEQKRLNKSGSFTGLHFDDGDPTALNRSRIGSGRNSRTSKVSRTSLNYSSEDMGMEYDSDGDHRRSFVIVQPQLKPKDVSNQ